MIDLMQRLLNLSFLDDRVRELGLKRWWLADQLGVDRKSVSRWFSGAVKHIKDENLAKLAVLLSCKPDELVLDDPSEAFASKADQQAAARLIDQENLINVLTPSGNWPLLESLIKATMQPDLPLPLLGALYNHLAIACWRQSKFDTAEAYAKKAHAIGDAIQSATVQTQARLSFGTICSFTGRLAEAQAHFEHVIARRAYLESERQVASALNNMAGVHHQRGAFDRAIAMQQEANTLFAEHGTPTGNSIGWSGLAMTFLEVDRLDDAVAACETSLRYARDAGHQVGIAFNEVLLADVAARRGDFAAANARLARGLGAIEAKGIKEPMYYVYAARVCRLQRDTAGARRHVATGLAVSDAYPVDRADLLMEAWRVDGKVEDLDAACALYEAAGVDPSARGAPPRRPSGR